jgi:toxin YoeB
VRISLTPNALDDLRWWLATDRKRAERILGLLAEILRTPFEGTGKPEPLKHQLAGCWSRRIDREHRLVYQVTEQEVIVIGCRHHY